VKKTRQNKRVEPGFDSIKNRNGSSVPNPKFASFCGAFRSELRIRREVRSNVGLFISSARSNAACISAQRDPSSGFSKDSRCGQMGPAAFSGIFFREANPTLAPVLVATSADGTRALCSVPCALTSLLVVVASWERHCAVRIFSVVIHFKVREMEGCAALFTSPAQGRACLRGEPRGAWACVDAAAEAG
jgi:hypothetical protein